MKRNNTETDYSQKLYEELTKVVGRPSGDKTLEDLIYKKISENGTSLGNVIFALKICLYFIEGNQIKTFYSDPFFSKMQNLIYKYFFEFCKEPTLNKLAIMQTNFLKLNDGADTIFKICSEIFKHTEINQFDLFLELLLKKNFIY